MPHLVPDPPLPPGPLATPRGQGTTASERYLAELAERTFLSMWSYPNLWRDQRAHGGKSGDGKELCDLLVVFDKHVLIFSDKHIQFKPHVDMAVAWRRWYKAAVMEAANQVFGAERWIRAFPSRIFLDPACTHRCPVPLPAPEELSIHRIIVARGVAAACRDYFGGGSGSLLVTPYVVGADHLLTDGVRQHDGAAPPGGPFMVGQVDPARGFVHVLDDTSLDLLMGTLNTVRDFVDYLEAKERFICSERLISATGEEDLLAFYLKRAGPSGRHDFVLPPDVDAIMITEGEWASFRVNPQRLAQIKADECSYAWDELIQRFAFHALNDTQYYATERGATHSEPALRLLAREPRTRRRVLSQAILGLVERTRQRQQRIEARMVEPSAVGDPHYVFVVLRRRSASGYAEYRDERRDVLHAYMEVYKSMRPSALDIVGIAFGTEESEEGGSEDLLWLDGRQWTDDDQRHAVALQRDTGFLSKTAFIAAVYDEYPDPKEPTTTVPFRAKGRDRNQLCSCGSGLKIKRCHGRPRHQDA